MERGFDGERRRRFDAHELYLLSMVFDVPIVYFFIPPPGTGLAELADTGRPVAELYASLLGTDDQLDALDERLAEINIDEPRGVDEVLAADLRRPRKQLRRTGTTTSAPGARSGCARSSASTATSSTRSPTFLAEFANQIKRSARAGYLRSTSHRPAEARSTPRHQHTEE